MAIIKKPIRKTLFYLASLAGVVSVLTIKLISGGSQANLSQLENQINKTLPSASGIVIPFVKADVPGVSCAGGGCATGDDDDDDMDMINGDDDGSGSGSGSDSGGYCGCGGVVGCEGAIV